MWKHILYFLKEILWLIWFHFQFSTSPFTVKKTLAYVKVCVGGDGDGAIWAHMCTLPHSHETEFPTKPGA